MKRAAKGILPSLRFINSFLPTRSTRSLHIQVTPYTLFPPFPYSSQAKPPHTHNFSNTKHAHHFSTKPNTIVELITTNSWSEELENELKKSIPNPTHETVLYVLKKLDKTPQKAFDFFNWVSEKNGFKPSFTVYNLMLRILGNNESMKEFWVLSKKMLDDGCEVDEETYLTVSMNFKNLKMMADVAAWGQFYSKMVKESTMDAVVKSVADVVSGSEWNDEVKKKLGKLKVTFSETVVLKTFKALRLCPLKALNFFRWLEGGVGYTHNAVTYNSILRVLGQEESIKEFWEVVKELKNAGHNIDIDTYVKLTRQLEKSKMMKDAVELYEIMMDSPYKPSIVSCSSLLRHISLMNTPDLDLVFRVVKKYEATGHTLSKTVYDGIHRSLTSVGRFDEAEKILVTMRNAGYEPDNITYSQAVFGLCKAGKLEEACKMLDEMEAQDCVPDIKTWTILIQGHCIAGEIDQALKCFTKMLGKNFEADADLMEVLVNGLCSKRRVDSAYTLFTEMVDKASLRPWQATYKTLIEKLLEERKLEEALNLLRLMKKHQFPPFPEPFVSYISKYGTVNDAKEFLNTLSMKQYPSAGAYLQILKSFFNEGRQSEARDLLYKCPHHIRNHTDVLSLFALPKPTEVTASPSA